MSSPATRIARATMFLVPGFPVDEQDTGCLTAIQNYVEGYAKTHSDRAVYVVAFHYPFVRRRYRWRSVTVHALAGKNFRDLRRGALWIRALWTALRIARTSDVDLLHSFWLGECTLIGQWASRWLGVPHVASIAGQDARADNFYLRLLRFDRMTITAGSASAADTFWSGTGREVDAVVPIGLDETFLQGAAGEHPRDIDVLGVGSLIPLKRYDVFVDLVGRLVSDRPQLQAVIVGDGPVRTTLERQVSDAGLRANVHLVGQKDRQDVLRYMQRSRVLLHPSEYEGQGYVLLEALGNGMHVVCRDVGFAGDHPAAYRCASPEEMLGHLRRALEIGRPPRGHVLTVDETIRRFDVLYERLSIGSA